MVHEINCSPMEASAAPAEATRALLSRLRGFCFPGGENAAEAVRGVKTAQRGEIRASPAVQWTPFAAEETIDATRSRFRWEAHLGQTTFVDAYEEAHGLCAVKLDGRVLVQKAADREIDQGELQRYLASIPVCPAILLQHPSLVWTAAGPLTLSVRDREDPAGATVHLEISEEGRPLVCRGDRPRMVGKQTFLTPWSGTYAAFRDCEGMRVASRVEVAWGLPEGEFPYYRAELTSFDLLR